MFQTTNQIAILGFFGPFAETPTTNVSNLNNQLYRKQDIKDEIFDTARSWFAQQMRDLYNKLRIYSKWPNGTWEKMICDLPSGYLT